MLLFSRVKLGRWSLEAPRVTELCMACRYDWHIPDAPIWVLSTRDKLIILLYWEEADIALRPLRAGTEGVIHATKAQLWVAFWGIPSFQGKDTAGCFLQHSAILMENGAQIVLPSKTSLKQKEILGTLFSYFYSSPYCNLFRNSFLFLWVAV